MYCRANLLCARLSRPVYHNRGHSIFRRAYDALVLVPAGLNSFARHVRGVGSLLYNPF